MLAFPVIFREVTVAARRKRTFILRCGVVLLLGWMTFQFILGQLLTASSIALGLALLGSFSGLMFFVVFTAATAMTCGCISDERKEGTLGLLFLTDLNSADIVLGKFFGKGFDALLLLLSAMPFLFVPILLGGVAWGQALGMVINLLALLVLALATGVWASTLARTTPQSWLVAYSFLGAYNLLPFVFRWIGSIHVPLGKWSFTLMWPAWLSQASPASGLLSGSAGSVTSVSITLLCCVVVAVLLLACAIWKVPRTIADADDGGFVADWRRNRLFSWLPFVRTVRPGNKLLDGNPIAWRETRLNRTLISSGMAAVLAIVAAVVAYLVHWLFPISQPAFGVMMAAGYLGILGIKILVIVSMSRSFVAEKQDGSLELLLSTPLSNVQVVDGKLQAARRRFAPALVVVLVLLVAGGVGAGSSESESLFVGLMGFLVVLIAYLDLYCTASICLFISAKSKTPVQALVLGVVATVVPLWLCSCLAVVVEPILAVTFYRALVKNLRGYATQ